MPRRKIPLETGNYYHVFNRGINKQQTFYGRVFYKYFQLSLWFYQYEQSLYQFSRYRKLLINTRVQAKELISQKEKLANVITYCLMPNHYHLLLQQRKDNGISRMMSDLGNSFTRFTNTLRDQSGPIFNTQFKAVQIETDDQLPHVSRYIHLNPYAGGLIKDFNQLIDYPWSSLNEYRNPNGFSISSPQVVIDFFGDFSSYHKFLQDQADYQKQLQYLSHLTLE